MAFEIYRTLSAGAGVAEEILGTASTQYAYGEALTVVSGIATKAIAAGKVTHITVNMFTPINTNRQDSPMLTTTAGEKLNVVKVAGGNVVLKSGLTGNSAPTINGTACNSNAVTTSLLVTFAGSTDDFTGGTCYVPEIDDGMHIITADSVGGGVHTFTVVPPFRRAPTTGDTVRAVPYSKGFTAVKLNGTTPTLGISNAVADDSGGHCKIEDVDLKNLFVLTTHPDLE